MITPTTAARARAQLLGSDRAESVAEVVRTVVAVQAQDVRPARLAVRVRSRGLVAADVDAACRDAVVVRTWLMRGTLHMVLADDVRWLLRVFGARNADKYAGRRRQLGLDDDLCRRALATLSTVLADRPMERAPLVAALAEDGVVIDPASQAPAHLLMLAASRGLVCRGPETDRDEPTYVLLDDWAPRTDEDPAADLGRLANRYLAGYGPADAADLAAWSGLPVGLARRAFAAAGIEQAEPVGSGASAVRLLGHFDNYLLGYQDRQVHANGGFIMPTVLVGGRAVAEWRMTPAGEVSLEPFEALSDRVQRGVRAELDDLARFLGKPVALVVR